MSSKQYGIEEARKILGDLALEVQRTGQPITLTRGNSRTPIARIAPLEDTMSPKITVANVRALLDAQDEAGLVLYIDADGYLAVDHESYAHPSRIVYTQEATRDLFRGSDEITDDDIRELLPDLQGDVDQVVESLNTH